MCQNMLLFFTVLYILNTMLNIISFSTEVLSIISNVNLSILVVLLSQWSSIFMHAEIAEQINKIILILRERFKIPMILHQSEGKSMSLCFNYPHFSLPNSWESPIFFFFLLFYLFQNVIQLESYYIIFQNSIFHLEMCNFMHLFCTLIAHLLPNSMLLYGYTKVCLPIHLLKNILVASSFWHVGYFLCVFIDIKF